MTIKNMRVLIKDKVAEGMDFAKEETTDVMGRVRKVASAANRKGKSRRPRHKKLVNCACSDATRPINK